MPLIRDGRVLALAVSSSKRASALPDVPTTVEAGFPNSDFDFWVGTFVPKQTPRAVVGKMVVKDERTAKIAGAICLLVAAFCSSLYIVLFYGGRTRIKCFSLV